MSRQNNAAPIIIKRKKVIVGGGHHGGAWKVAYADFVTAMMAFFLMMWLLGATTESQRRGLADYFNPSVPVHRISSGGDGMFGGTDAESPDETAPAPASDTEYTLSRPSMDSRYPEFPHSGLLTLGQLHYCRSIDHSFWKTACIPNYYRAESHSLLVIVLSL